MKRCMRFSLVLFLAVFLCTGCRGTATPPGETSPEQPSGNLTADQSPDTGTAADEELFEKVKSYTFTWKWRDAGNEADNTIEGTRVQPDSFRMVTRQADGDAEEIVIVGSTAKLRSGEGDWLTIEGESVSGMDSMGDSFVSQMKSGYSFLAEHKFWKRENGGTVNGYATEKYTYTGPLDDRNAFWSLNVISSGEFRGIITHYEVHNSETDTSGQEWFIMDVADLNAAPQVKLP